MKRYQTGKAMLAVMDTATVLSLLVLPVIYGSVLLMQEKRAPSIKQKGTT